MKKFTSILLILLGLIPSIQAQLLDINWAATDAHEGWTLTTDYTSETLPDGFSFTNATGDVLTVPYKAGWEQVNSLILQQATANVDYWFTYTTDGLTVNATYTVTVNAMVQNNKINMTIAGWDTNANNVPADATVNANEMADSEYTYGKWTEYTKSFVATSTSMTFGIGFNKSGGGPQFNVSALKIEKTGQDVPTSVEESTTSSVKAFPNPTSGEFTLTNTDGIAKYVIANIAGQIVASSTINGKNDVNVNISNLANGSYLVNITDTNGTVSTIKLIKK